MYLIKSSIIDRKCLFSVEFILMRKSETSAAAVGKREMFAVQHVSVDIGYIAVIKKQ